MTSQAHRNLAAIVLALALSSGAQAQDAAIGAQIYQQYCATCHGAEAAGGGPMAPILTLQPPSLTDLTARYGGAFPMQRVVDRIDGQEPLVAHGSPMPVYGLYFNGIQDVAIKAPSGQPVLVSQPIADLVAFLQAIQQ